MACRPLPEEDESVPLSLADALVEFMAELRMAEGKQHAAAVMIAKRDTDLFLKRYGGGRRRIPSRVNYTRDATKARRELALALIHQGVPWDTIVKTMKISRRTLYRIQGKKS